MNTNFELITLYLQNFWAGWERFAWEIDLVISLWINNTLEMPENFACTIKHQESDIKIENYFFSFIDCCTRKLRPVVIFLSFLRILSRLKITYFLFSCVLVRFEALNWWSTNEIKHFNKSTISRAVLRNLLRRRFIKIMSRWAKK